MEYKISKLRIIKWYRKNYRRLCFELNKQIEDNKLIIESNKIACESLNKTIEKLQKENEELKEKIREFEIGRLGE